MGNSASALPYSIGKQVAVVNDGWALHEGNRKSDNAVVSVFMAKKPALSKNPVNRSSPNMSQLAPAIHHFQNCKRLRHPHILKVYATLDTDRPNESAPSGSGGGTGGAAPKSGKAETGDLIIVTESCMSLDAWLQTSPPPEQLAWGLEAIVRALHFLHGSANLAHGNLSPSSFFVTPAGDVKLWNFSLVTGVGEQVGGIPQHFIEWEGLVTPQPYRSPERQERRWDALSAAGVHAMDSYGLGVLIDHLYNGRIPMQLTKAVQRLQTSNIRMRPRLQPLLRCPVFDTPYQKLQLQLEEFTVQPVEQKLAFWQNLLPSLQAGLITEPLAVHKLLPLMKSSIETFCGSDSMRSQDLYRREVSSILQPMFYIGETYLDETTFSPELAKIISMLYAVNDRGVRGALLQKSALFAKYLDNNALNQSVFEPMCSGFSDSSAGLRELTLKATLGLVPYLTQPNVEKLSRYLVRLQGDPEPSIRTNTVIFFSKLAPHLSEMSRHKLLLPAITRAVGDPFMPCRLAALQSTLKVKEYFDPKGVASRLLPAVTPCLLDSAAGIRKEAFIVVDDLLFHLRQESERMNSMPDPNGPNSAAGQPAAAPGATSAPPSAPAPSNTPATESAPSSGYLSGLSSWMSSSAKPLDSSAPGKPSPAPAPLPPQQRPVAPPLAQPIPAMSSLNMQEDDMGGDMDGWDDPGDGWDDTDDLDLSSGGVKSGGGTAAAVPVANTAGNSLFAPAPQPAGHLGSGDEFFGLFDDKPATSVAMRPKTGGGKLAIPSKKQGKPAPVVKKLAMDDVEDGWDDF